MVAAPAANRDIVATDDSMASTAANIGGEVEPVYHRNAKRSTCQEPFRAYKGVKAAILEQSRRQRREF